VHFGDSFNSESGCNLALRGRVRRKPDYLMFSVSLMDISTTEPNVGLSRDRLARHPPEKVTP
jgi:hypothetical protein